MKDGKHGASVDYVGMPPTRLSFVGLSLTKLNRTDLRRLHKPYSLPMFNY